MKIIAHGATDLGRKRSVNEDNYRICPKLKLFLVADGMGGHIAGEIASRLAVDIVAEAIQHELAQTENNDYRDLHPGQLLEKTVQLANRKILETASKRRELEGMGTTIVAAIIRGRTLHIASVGDSRVYRIRDKEGQLLTFDHSWVNMQVRLGNMTVEEARYHPMRNVITRALGTQRQVEVDIMAHLIRQNDTILLCTDGLSNVVQIDEIAQIVTLSGDDIEKATEGLIQLANDRGGDDNITAVILKFQSVDSEEIDDYDLDEETDQDTEIIPKDKLRDRLSQSRFPLWPP
ncbi:Stp1/IreP family PP2C-type Ser/Thr phosphatase [bacterium]|nr:Stp1/IreP family PP2C-type Ser/Thr phosphatase [candidate division CSSED10-310 bacterium]